MTQPLVTSSDTDLDGWQSGDQDTFLAMVCAEVQKYCGWHIAPSIPVTGQRCWFGSDDLIMLPSTYVTSVDQVTVDGQVLVADTDYFWDSPKPWIKRKQMWWPHDHFAIVNFTHGYTETPQDVKAVVFEVMATAMELPASNADRVQSMQYSFELRPDTGIALSDRQKHRLGHYRIPKFGGRP